MTFVQSTSLHRNTSTLDNNKLVPNEVRKGQQQQQQQQQHNHPSIRDERTSTCTTSYYFLSAMNQSSRYLYKYHLHAAKLTKQYLPKRGRPPFQSTCVVLNNNNNTRSFHNGGSKSSSYAITVTSTKHTITTTTTSTNTTTWNSKKQVLPISSPFYSNHRGISSTTLIAQPSPIGAYNDEQFQEKVTKRLLDSEIGSLNQASLLELITAISSWHKHITSNQSSEYAFFQANALFERFIQEFEFWQDVNNHEKNTCINTDDNNNNRQGGSKQIPTVKIDIDTINLVLDSWRIVNNTRRVHGRQQQRNTLNGDDDDDDDDHGEKPSLFVDEGVKILKRCCEMAKKYGDDLIHHPDTKTFNLVLDGYSKLGMVDEATKLFNEMETTAQSRPECRLNIITYNSLLSTYANSTSSQVENAQKAAELLDDMLTLYNQTGSPDVKPGQITFSIVISAYANASSLSTEAPHQAEHVFKTMLEMYNSSLVENGGDGEWIDLKPNHVSYTSLISAWSNSGHDDAIDRAANVLKFMQTAGGSQSNATTEHTTALVESYSNSGGEDSTVMILNLMEKMLSVAESTGDISMMPTTATFTALIDCMAKSAGQKKHGDGGEAAMRSETILKKMEELYESGYSDLRPTTAVYNALINAWAKSMRSDAGERAEEWLKKMEKMYLSGYDCKPDAITFSSTILAYANTNNGKEAERILMEMYEAYKTGEKECKPSTFSFSTAIQAYANQGKPEEAKRLLALMGSLPDLDDVEPDSNCLNCVLNAYINSEQHESINSCLEFLDEMDKKGMSDSASYASVMEKLNKVGKSWTGKKGEELLARMWAFYDQGNAKLKPTSTVYISLINLLARSNKPQVSGKAVDLLNELLQKYDETKDPDLTPNTVAFNAALSALIRSPNRNRVQEAEKILQQMEELYDQGNRQVKPDGFSFTNLISCYANSDTAGSAERAEEILQQMQTLYDEDGDKSMRPTTVAFGAVVHGWARQGNADRAQAIVDHMETLQDRYTEMSTNTVIYNTLINGWAKSGREESGQKAEEILVRMQELFEKGKEEVKPSRVSYNSVLSAYYKSREHNAHINAKRIVQEMEANPDPFLQPDVVTYTTLMNVISRSRDPMKVDTAEQILEKMKVKKLKPNNFTYDAVLRTCVQVQSRDRHQRRKALILSVKTLGEVQDSPHVTPTSYTYSLFFSSLSKFSSHEEQQRLLTRSLQDCCKAGLLNESILNLLRQKFPSQLIQSILSPSGTSNKMCIQNLPKEWSRNSHQKLPSTTSQRQNERTQHHTGRRKITRR